MPRRAVLDLADLSVHRGKVALLRQVSWRIEPGQHWVVLGANGSGKTTLLKLLTGLMTPSTGRIEVDGHLHGASDWREVRKKIGLVSSALQAHIPPAEPAIETVISGRYDQLDLWAPFTPTDQRVARTLLRQFGLGGLTDRPWAWLSQGERQRVLIARALAAQPKLLILDEPCAGLDPVARADFLDSVDELARSSRAPTLVLVTHHVEEITPAFSHVLLLAGGQVTAKGARKAVLTNPHLSRTFGRPLQLRRHGAQLTLRVPARG
jgi:iron complex transport system ATP-binding protein